LPSNGRGGSLQMGLSKRQPVAEGGKLLSGSQKEDKEEGRAVRLRPFGTPPSVVPKGRTSDAPLSALMNNTVEFRTQDVPLLRSQTLNVYLNFHPKSAYLSHLADCG
jgi:hypothetical protein